MGGGFNYNGGYGGSGFSGSFGGGYSYGVSVNPIAFVFYLVDLFYTSKSERERFYVHVKSSPSAYTFKSTVRLKNVSGSGTSTVYAGGGKRQGGLTSSQRSQLRDMVDAMEYRDFWQQRGAWVETQDRSEVIAGNLQIVTSVLLFEIPSLSASMSVCFDKLDKK